MERGDHFLYFSDVARVRVTMGGRLAARRGWRWDHPGGLEDSLLIWYVTAGSGTMELGGRRQALAPETLLFPRLWEPLAARQDDRAPFGVLWASLEGLDEEGAIVDLSRLGASNLPPIARRLADGAFARGLMERLVDPFVRGSGLNDESDLWLVALLRETARADARRTDVGTALGVARPAIEAIVRDVLANPARAWSMAELARRLHCTPDHFTRTFRAATGQTPQRFVVGARIAAAKSLLRTSSLSVTAIADSLGYGDVYFFSKQFRRETGVTPTAYRRGGSRG